MQDYPLTRLTETLNEWREIVRTWAQVGTIRAAVSVADGRTMEENQLLRISSTHRAVTWRTDVRQGDRFGGYSVDYVIPGTGRRMTQLYLTKEEEADVAGD